MRLLHSVVVETFHALGVVGVFFENGGELVHGAGIGAHGDAEHACLCDDGVEGFDGGGHFLRVEDGGAGGEEEDGAEVGPEDTGDVVDVVGEIGREGAVGRGGGEE